MRTFMLVMGLSGLFLGVLMAAVFIPRGLWQPVKLGVVYFATGLGLLGLCGLMADRPGA